MRKASLCTPQVTLATSQRCSQAPPEATSRRRDCIQGRSGHQVGGGSSEGGGKSAGDVGENRSMASVKVQATFQLRGLEAQKLAHHATQIIDGLHQLSNRTDCECDLDVELQWQEKPDAEASSAS